MKTISFIYKKIITAQSEGVWEKMIFADSYREFCMQGQLFSNEGQYMSFAQMQAALPRASQLHHLVSTSVIGYLRQLQGVIPDLRDSVGQLFLPFDQYRFEIMASHLQQQSQHQVAIFFYSLSQRWHDTIGDSLLLSADGVEADNDHYQTHLFTLPPHTGIYSLQTDQEK
ncbi:MAG: hypothetical protein QM781_08730 [Chitinophagaceae bacterium]